jgi:hypothetical protein
MVYSKATRNININFKVDNSIFSKEKIDKSVFLLTNPFLTLRMISSRMIWWRVSPAQKLCRHVALQPHTPDCVSQLASHPSFSLSLSPSSREPRRSLPGDSFHWSPSFSPELHRSSTSVSYITSTSSLSLGLSFGAPLMVFSWLIFSNCFSHLYPYFHQTRP